MCILFGLHDFVVFKQKTAYELRISDWSSDVCSSDLAETLGLAAGDVVIGYIGSFYDYEGIDDLIAAMPALVVAQPKARLLLVGGGPMEAALKAQAAASSAASQIHFVGRVPHGEVELYYSLIDILAYTRKKLRLTDLVPPLKTTEAMETGKTAAETAVADGKSGGRG